MNNNGMRRFNVVHCCFKVQPLFIDTQITDAELYTFCFIYTMVVCVNCVLDG